MSHQLALEIPNISNPKTMRIYDTSVWDESITVTSLKLDIVVPGFSESVTFTVTKGFDRLFNSSTLGLGTVTDPADLSNIPDGIYIVRLTANSEWVEYNYLRQVCLLRDYYKALCSLNFYPCNTLDIDLEAKRRELMQIKAYMDAAKAKVEWCLAPLEGIDLHNFAKKLLSKFSLEKCKNC